MQNQGVGFGGQRGPGNFTIVNADKFILNNGVVPGSFTYPLLLPDSAASAPSLAFSSAPQSGLSYNMDTITLSNGYDSGILNVITTGNAQSTSLVASNINSSVLVNATGDNSHITINTLSLLAVTNRVIINSPETHLANTNRVLRKRQVLDFGTLAFGHLITPSEILDFGIFIVEANGNPEVMFMPFATDFVNAITLPSVGDTFMFTIINTDSSIDRNRIQLEPNINMIPVDPAYTEPTVEYKSSANIYIRIDDVSTPRCSYWLVAPPLL